MTWLIWLALAVIVFTVWALVKRLETRLVLIIAGLVLCFAAGEPIRCHTNFRHPFNLSWSGKTCDIRRSSKTTS
ncbi:MAG: hypothetical protein KHY61_09875 [Sutterella wadsworthensis]|nr:hypothetical protein [Sutterella wadsworthensis]